MTVSDPGIIRVPQMTQRKAKLNTKRIDMGEFVSGP